MLHLVQGLRHRMAVLGCRGGLSELKLLDVNKGKLKERLLLPTA